MSGLLVTGASGLIGGDLLDRVAPHRAGARIYLLARDPDRIPARFHGPQFSILTGDIRRPMLGLADWQTSALRRTLTEIVHCAADTRLDAPASESHETNCAGTENLLRLAAGCDRLTKFLHVSTIYTAGRLAGAIPESVFTHSARFCNSCERSKYEAESMVASYASSVPVVIARLGTIVGDANGSVRRQNCVHRLLRLFPKAHLQLAPYEPLGQIGLIAGDWAADALAWLFLRSFQAGAVWHLTGGPAASFTAAEALAETHRLFAHHPNTQRWLPIELPRLAPLAEYDDYVERTLASGSRLTGELLRAVDLFLPHLGIARTFDDRRTRALLAPSGLEPVPVRQLWADVVRWCLDTDWGRNA